MKYWIVVVSKDHIARGIEGGFMQANHGKEAPLKRMDVGDGVIFYSPKKTYGGNEVLQAFTAIGEVADDKIYQHKMADDFIPYRRNINYFKCQETPIAPLINELDFIENKTSWGYKFRFGFFEIPERDYKLIRSAMIE
jgi:predicted RNA-binding protein